MRVTKEMLKTKAKYFNSGARHAVVSTHMDLLGITDVSTPRQEKNGTIVWRLPIKYGKDRFIEVASFATGYVRNQNGGYTNYQLNKRCESEPQYYELANGNYNRYTTRTCKLIPREIDRLEYLIGYCLKNYYIKKANEVVNGSYVSKWEHEYKLERQSNTANHQFEMNALQNKLANSVPKWKYDELESRVDVVNDKLVNSKDYTADLKARLTKVTRECNHAYDCGLSDGEKKANSTYGENTGAMARITNLSLQNEVLQNKLELRAEAVRELEDRVYELTSQVDLGQENTIDLKAQLHMSQEKLSATKVRQDVSVIVNGHRYKVL